MVAEAAKPFVKELPAETQEIILAACWCHDLIEDARETYNDVKKVLGEPVAELVYALTNEKGRTRAERANEKYYAGIRSTPYATLIKVCDRIANVRHSKAKGSRMFQVYGMEYVGFKRHLYQAGEWEDAWQTLEQLLELAD
ncbi:MAG: phosphohydrolase [Bacteroidota bacterium]